MDEEGERRKCGEVENGDERIMVDEPNTTINALAEQVVFEDGNAFRTPAPNLLKDDTSQTSDLIDKFRALSDQWSVTSSTSRRLRRCSPNHPQDTQSLVGKLDELADRWKQTPSPHHQEIYSTYSYDSSSLGHTTLSSKDEGHDKLSVFERLYRNERKHHYRRRKRSSIDPATPNSSLQRRLWYGAHVRNNWTASKSRSQTTPRSSASTTATPTDSVFERLYRRKPRSPVWSSSSVKSAPTVVRTKLNSSRRAPSFASSTASPTSPTSGTSDHQVLFSESVITIPRPTDAVTPNLTPRRQIYDDEPHAITSVQHTSCLQSASQSQREEVIEKETVTLQQYPTEKAEAVALQQQYETYMGTKTPPSQQATKAEVLTLQQQRDLNEAMKADQQRRELIHQQQQAALAATVIQKFVRHHQLKQYNQSAALVVQHHYRQYLTRRRAVTKIQSHWRRTTCARAVYRQAIWCAPQFQRLLLRYLTGPSNSTFLLANRGNSVRLLQARARGFLIRQRYRRLERAAGVIQQAWRRHCAARRIQRCWRRRFIRYVGVLLVQRWWRMLRDSVSYRKQRAACVVIQQWMRRERAAVRIQSMVRMGRARDVFIQDYERILRCEQYIAQQQNYDEDSIVLVQSLIRRWLVQRRIIVTWYAALIVQGRWRLYRRERVNRHAAASRVQGIWRLHRRQVQRSVAAALYLQSWWRMVSARRRWLQQTAACRCIQLTARQWMARRIVSRRKLEVLTRRAVLIQSLARMHTIHRVYEQKRVSVIMLQQCVRRHTARQHYSATVRAVLLGQRWWRRILLQRQVTRSQAAATCLIQRRWRQSRATQHHSLSAKRLQSFWRMQREHLRFQSHRHACILLQTHLRAWRARTIFRRELLLHHSATQLQTQIKIWLTCRKVRDLQKRTTSATILQARVRGRIAARQWEEHKGLLERENDSARLLQGCIRSWLGRQQLKHEANSAQLIQESARDWIRRIAAQRSRERSARLIQAKLRGWITRTFYLRLLSNTALLQARIRGLIARENHRERVRERNCSACVLQSYARGRMVRKTIELHYKRDSQAQLIQRFYRGWTARRQLKLQEYQLETRRQENVILIQSNLRKWMVRSQLQHENVSSLRIQSYFRRWMVERKCAGAQLIQAHFRGWLERIHIQREYSALCIQASVRRWIERREMKLLDSQSHANAQIIQAYMRGWTVRLRRERAIQASLLLQGHFRGWVARRNMQLHQSQLEILRHASAQLIQSNFRMWMMSAQIQQAELLAAQRHANTQIIQALARGWMARKLVWSLRDSESQARVIQKYSRGWATRRNVRLEESQLETKRHANARMIQTTARRWIDRKAVQFQRENSALCIQRFFLIWRRMRELEQHAAARLIQAHVLGWSTRKSIENQKQIEDRGQLSAVVIQAYARRWFALRMLRHRNRFKAEVEICAILVQAQVRGWLSRELAKRMHEYKSKQLVSALVIQAHVRTWKTRMTAERQQLASTVLMQSQIRGWLGRRKVKVHYQLESHINAEACLLIQARARGWMRRLTIERGYLEKRRRDNAAVSIQTWLRMCVTRRRSDQLTRAVAVIQSFIKRSIAWRRKKMEISSVLRIQVVWRMHQAHSIFTIKQAACIKIQRMCRLWSTKRFFLAEKNLSDRRDDSAVAIQSLARLGFGRKQYMKLRLSCIRIQHTWRCFCTRRDFLRAVNAIRIIQEFWTASTRRLILRHQQNSSSLIQSNWHRYMARKRYESKVQSCTKIQSFWRQKHHASMHQNRIRAATKIQAAWRCSLARERFASMLQSIATIQAQAQTLALQNQQRILVSAALLVQRVWRDHSRRQRQLQVKRIERWYQSRMEYRKQLAATTHQRNWRDHSSSRLSAATKIQTFARKSRDMYTYKTKRREVGRIQRFFRLTDSQAKLKSSITLLQRAWRQKNISYKYTKQRNSALTIQKRYRDYVVRKHKTVCSLEKVSKQHVAATAVQRVWRSYAVRSSSIQENTSALLLQTTYRCYVAKRRYSRTLVIFVKLQSVIRGSLARTRVVVWTQRRVSASRTIQTFWRVRGAPTHQSRYIPSFEPGQHEIVRGFAATAIQTAWKRYRAQGDFVNDSAKVWIPQETSLFIETERKHACRRIQLAWREHRIKGTVFEYSNITQKSTKSSDDVPLSTSKALNRDHFVSDDDENDAAVVVQALWRAYMTRFHIREKHQSATMIQTFWRTHFEDQLSAVEDLSIRLQSVARCVLALQREDKAFLIQCWWRRWVRLSPHLRRRREAASIIHSFCTHWKIQGLITRLQKTVALFQYGVFGSLGRSVACYSLLQVKSLERHSSLLRLASLEQRQCWEASKFDCRKLACTLIQAFFRGYKCRSQLSRCTVTPFRPKRLPDRSASCNSVDIISRLSPTEVVSDDVYRGRIERRALQIVRAHAEIEAERLANSILHQRRCNFYEG